MPEDIKETLLSSYISEDENQVRISSRVLETSKTLKRNDLLNEIENILENEFGFIKEKRGYYGVENIYFMLTESFR